jgi:lysophospholipase L1-like esterase
MYFEIGLMTKMKNLYMNIGGIDKEAEYLPMSKVRKILYIGASVTAQKAGFRPSLTKLIAEKYGHEVEEKAVANGGTGSLYALCSLSQMPLDDDYDLAILEYSTGDLNIGLTPINLIGTVVDQIITKMRSISKSVINVHNYKADKEGDTGDSVRLLYDKAADSQGVPTIDNAKLMEALKVELSEAEWADLYRDKVHTNPAGGDKIAEHMLACLEDMGGAPINRFTGEAPEIGAGMTSISKLLGRRDGEYTHPITEQVFPYVTFQKSEKLEIMVKGEFWGIVSIVGPQSAWCLAKENDNEFNEFTHFDSNCYYMRVKPRLLRRVYKEYTKLSFEISDKEVDFTICKREHDGHKKPRLTMFSMLMGNNLEVKLMESN